MVILSVNVVMTETVYSIGGGGGGGAEDVSSVRRVFIWWWCKLRLQYDCICDCGVVGDSGGGNCAK